MMLWRCAHALTPRWSVLHRGFTVFHLHRLALSRRGLHHYAAGYSYLCAEYEPDNILHDAEYSAPPPPPPPPPPDPLQFSHCHTVDRALSRLHLPVRLKGGGLRSSLCTTRAAFWGSVNASFPRLVDTKDNKEGEVVPGFFGSRLSD